MRNLRTAVSVICFSVALVGCGGGGGSTDATGTPNPSTQPAKGQQGKPQAPQAPSVPETPSAPGQPPVQPPSEPQAPNEDPDTPVQNETPPVVAEPVETEVPPPPPVEPPAPPNPVAVNRSTTDRPDEVRGSQIHIIYAIPSDGVDRSYDLTDRFINSALSVNVWLKDQVNLSMRFDTYDGGKLDITFARLPRTEAEYEALGSGSFAAIESDLQSRMSNNKIYAIYYDGYNSRTCGEAGSQLNGHQSTVMYIQGFRDHPTITPCDRNPVATSPTAQPTYLDYMLLHELLHVIGIPHVDDSEFDLMYGGSTRWDVPEQIVLDYNRDDYAFDRSTNNHSRAQPNIFDSPFFE